MLSKLNRDNNNIINTSGTIICNCKKT